MKQFIVEVSPEAHKVLQRIQFERKMAEKDRTTLKEIATDVLNKALLDMQKPDQK